MNINEVKTYKHRQNGKEIRGILLQKGDVILGSDVYDAEGGEWESVSPIIVGTTLSEPMGKQFVRPTEE